MIVSHQPPTVVNRWWRGVGARVVLGLAIVVASSGPFGASRGPKSQTYEEVNKYPAIYQICINVRRARAPRRRPRALRARAPPHEVTKCATKKSVFFSKIKKSVFLPVFSRKPNSFRGPGGFCWRIGVTAALLGRLLPSDGHKLVKKPEI